MNLIQHRPLARLLQPAMAGDRLLGEVAVLLGIPDPQAQQLAEGGIELDRGCACRLMLDRGPPPGGVRPCLQLPVSAAELGGIEVVRLLALQAQLLAEGLWYLGISRDGKLQLTALQLFRVANDIVQVIEVAQATARLVQHALALHPLPACEALPPGEPQ